MLINFHMGVTLRCYGDVEIEAESVEAALPLLTADYIGENIDIKETTTDSGQDLAIITATDMATGDDAGEWGGHFLPSPYDPKPAETAAKAAAFTAMLAALEGFVDACGGNAPDWLEEEFAACEDAIALAKGAI